ncbi:MAG: DNA mismatch repair endonuclease MutL [Clostridia bacterium]|nr:DNA mismatch repair endonuclease MutL [Clostridia bacterium]
MGKINVLSFAVANLIAAGEVVDRPSSVIKELVENSIDSGAKQITVEIKNGGITYMRVSDNGCGIEAEDLPVAIKRHATSKIKTSDDLMKILTLGFRGEALAAIASVSDLRIISKTADSTYGAMIEAHGGEIVEYSEQAARNGTTVIVENLFANIPARRKFLKRDATEGSAIATIIEKIALSHPEVAFRFISDGSVKLDTPGDGKLENVIYIIMGKQMQNAMIYIDSTINDIRVQGYIGRSDVVKSNRNYQNFFINNRYIKSKLAIAAIEQAYTSYLAPEKFPCCVLNLTINPSTVDINVHPTKLEVKFANEKPVFEAIYHSVKTALEENTTRPEIQIGANKKDSFSRMSSEQYRNIASARPVSEAFAPIQNSSKEDKVEQIKYTDIPDMTVEKKVISQPVLPQPQEDPETVIPKEAYETEEKYSNMPREEFLKLSPEEVIVAAINHYQYFQTEGDEDIEDIEFAKSEASGLDLPNFDNSPLEFKTPAIPVYGIVGEVFNAYLIVEREDKMLIIDKHAAHERIIFEKNKEMMKSKEPSSQILISPLDVMLTSAEIAIVNDYLEDFEKLGFKIVPKKYSVEVYSIPTELSSCDVQDTISTMVNRIKDGQGNAKLTRDILFEKALYQASCKAAIKAGREYVEAHTEWIVEQLMKIPDITFCPHGRPVAMELSKKNLDYQFERS